MVYCNLHFFLFHRVGGKGNAVQKCYSCNGNGVKISIQPIGPGMVQQVQKVCPDCQGDGNLVAS